jgi:hypothetical protein
MRNFHWIIGLKEAIIMGFVKKAVKACVRKLQGWLYEERNPEIPFDNRHEWLSARYRKLKSDPVCAKKPEYIWGVLQGAALGKVLGFERISVIEFGVAGGRGLLAMEQAAELAEREIGGIQIDVYGFDAGIGLPKPQDYRDLPNLFFDGQYSMDRHQLERRLRRAQLKLGLVEDTIPGFLDSNPAPIAFVSMDLDLYSSTTNALKVFEAHEQFFLPRVLCYFDDILGYTYSEYNGERLAISEFNDRHSMRKISLLYGLKYYVRCGDSWTDKMFFLHAFDHSLYNHPDSLQKARRIDMNGRTEMEKVSSAERQLS